MYWAYDPKTPNTKILVSDPEDARLRGLQVETEEEAAAFTERKKQFDNDDTASSYCPKASASRIKRGEKKPYVYFKTKEGEHLNIAQNREGRQVLRDEVQRKYGDGATIEGDF